MSRLLLMTCFIFWATSVNAQGLSADVQKDMHMLSLAKHLKAKEFEKSWKKIQQLKALNVELPKSLDYFEGEAACNTGRFLICDKVLRIYIDANGTSGRYYKRALELLSNFEDKIQQAHHKLILEKREQAELRQKQADRQLRKKEEEKQKKKRRDKISWEKSVITSTLEGHKRGVLSICFSKNSSYLLSGSADQTVKFWNLVPLRVIKTFKDLSYGGVASVAFSPDENYTANGHAYLTLRDTRTGEIVWNADVKSSIDKAIFSSNGKMILAKAYRKVRIWYTKSGKTVSNFKIPDSFSSVAFSPKNYFVITAHHRTLQSWNVKSGKKIADVKGNWNNVFSLTYSPNGEKILLGDDSDRVWILEAKTGKTLKAFRGHSQTVISAEYSPNGKYIVSGSKDHTVRLWDAETGRKLAVLITHKRDVNQVAFSPDGRHIASASDDKKILIWDIQKILDGSAEERGVDE